MKRARKGSFLFSMSEKEHERFSLPKLIQAMLIVHLFFHANRSEDEGDKVPRTKSRQLSPNSVLDEKYQRTFTSTANGKAVRRSMKKTHPTGKNTRKG